MSADGAEQLVDTQRFADLYRIARRASPYTGEGFDVENPPCWNQLCVLVVGAGGLGCELLHCLALTGFTDVHVIDMDTIDLTNLTRQFLFRHKDIGEPKSNVAASFINTKFPWMRVVPHFGKIQDESDDFYRQFHICILGLDSIHARQWMSAKFASLRTPVLDEATGTVTYEGVVPIIDGGTEGFKGSVRHISLGKTACVDCAMYLYPPRKTVPMCTLENVPRAPEHCVLYVKEKSWQDDKPFDGCNLDGDNPLHIEWIVERAKQRQEHFNIGGEINFRFTQGAVKNVVPAVGFTNAMIAAMCVNEAFKLATGIGKPFDNYLYYDGGRGICCYTQPLWNNPDCEVCQMRHISLTKDTTPEQFAAQLLPKLREILKGDARVLPLLKDGSTFNIRVLLPSPVDWVSIMLPDSHPLRATAAPYAGRSVHAKLIELCDQHGWHHTAVSAPVVDVMGGPLSTLSYRYAVTWKA